MGHTIDIIVGDWSDDGHGKTYKKTIICTHSGSEIKDAHEKLI